MLRNRLFTPVKKCDLVVVEEFSKACGGMGVGYAVTDLMPWGLWKGGGVVALVPIGGAGFTLAAFVSVNIMFGNFLEPRLLGHDLAPEFGQAPEPAIDGLDVAGPMPRLRSLEFRQ